MTDYLDKQLGMEESGEIEKHFKICPDCREFFEAVQKTAVTPFKEIRPLLPDPVVWRRIHQKINAANQTSAWLTGLTESMATFWRMARPVLQGGFAVVLILGMVILARWPANYEDSAYAYLEEQMDFLGELEDGNTELLNGELADYDLTADEIGVK